MKQLFITFLVIFSIVPGIQAQTEAILQGMTSDDYAKLVLPPLSVLYESAEQNPSVEILRTDKKIAERLLKQDKKAWLSFFAIKAGYTYGKTDNYGTVTDVSTPIFYQYTGLDQHYYNVGANININLETLFTLRDKVKKQRLEIERAEFVRQKELILVKQDIARLYMTIISDLNTLKASGENVVVSEGRYKVVEEKFKNRTGTLEDLAASKANYADYVRTYEEIRTRVNSSILFLEIITNTPILSNNRN